MLQRNNGMVYLYRIQFKTWLNLWIAENEIVVTLVLTTKEGVVSKINLWKLIMLNVLYKACIEICFSKFFIYQF